MNRHDDPNCAYSEKNRNEISIDHRLFIDSEATRIREQPRAGDDMALLAQMAHCVASPGHCNKVGSSEVIPSFDPCNVSLYGA